MQELESQGLPGRPPSAAEWVLISLLTSQFTTLWEKEEIGEQWLCPRDICVSPNLCGKHKNLPQWQYAVPVTKARTYGGILLWDSPTRGSFLNGFDWEWQEHRAGSEMGVPSQAQSIVSYVKLDKPLASWTCVSP